MSWRINPKTGDYVQEGGRPTDDPSLIYPAYYRLKVRRNQWLYAPNAAYGSDFYTVKKRFNPNDANPLANMTEVALQPMVEDGRAAGVDAYYLAPAGRNDAELEAVITDAQGEPQTLKLPPIGI